MIQFDHLAHKKPEAVKLDKASRRREDKSLADKKLLWVEKRSKVRINSLPYSNLREEENTMSYNNPFATNLQGQRRAELW